MNLHQAFELQKNSYRKNGQLPVSNRKQILKSLLNILIDNKNAICEALREDFSSRDAILSEFSDINPAVQSIKYAISNIDKWVKPKKVATTPALLGFIGASAQIEFQAKGVIGVLSPWNFPINLTFGPLAGIIAAGNRALVKPSELTPKTSELIAGLISKEIDPEYIHVIIGGIEVASEFARLPFDHIMFTGATSIGRKVMAAASENLVPVTLELGGKSPAIISKTADIKTATTRIIAGKLMNAGQVCLAPDYVILTKHHLEAFIANAREAVAQQYPTILNNPEYTAIINDRHFSRLNRYLEEARSANCDIIEINPANESLSATNTRKILPTLVINPSFDSGIMKDEIFGPILPIIVVDEIKNACEIINSQPRPLALYYFGNSRHEEEFFLDKCVSGGATINDVIFHIAMENLPFGGVGDSGIGAYHGHRGFLEFSHQKSVYRQLKRDNFLLKSFRPPYGDIIKKYLKFEMRK